MVYIKHFSDFVLSLLVLIICTTLFADLAHAQETKGSILLISDIDDTIKVSEILTPIKFLRAADTNTPFAGMASLYQLIVNQNPSKTHVFYLSNAPREVLGLEPMRISHELLLEQNRFPKGELILRESMSDEQHKNRTIRALVKKYQPSLVIFVGDNGERDVITYEIAAEELKKQNTPSLTYIHQLYSKDSFWSVKQGKALRAQQVGYATPLEIAMDLVQKKKLSQKSLDWMFAHTAKYIMSEAAYLKVDALSSLSFPFFKDCSDFKWQESWGVNAQNADYKIFLENRCH